MIVRELSGDGRRFSALQRSLNGVSHKVLTAQLRELEADGVVWRRVYSEVPPRVEYGLTERGQALLPVLEGLNAWGRWGMRLRRNQLSGPIRCRVRSNTSGRVRSSKGARRVGQSPSRR